MVPHGATHASLGKINEACNAFCHTHGQMLTPTILNQMSQGKDLMLMINSQMWPEPSLTKSPRSPQPTQQHLDMKHHCI